MKSVFLYKNIDQFVSVHDEICRCFRDIAFVREIAKLLTSQIFKKAVENF